MPGDSSSSQRVADEDEEELPGDAADVDEFSMGEELSGSPGKDPDKEGLMHTVLDADKDAIDLGNMVLDGLNNNVSFFTPELLMEKLVNDYRSAEELYGQTVVRRLSGYDPSYVEKNLNIPEFRREFEKQVKQNVKELQRDGFLDRDGSFTEKAVRLASLVLAVEELDHLTAEGVLGERVHKKRSVSGTREDVKPFSGEPYRQINVQQSVKTALRRGHDSLRVEDLRAYEREARGSASVVYAVDASGSMKGAKLAQAKRAGVALAYKAVDAGDKVGLLVFEKDVKQRVRPHRDFPSLLKRLTRLQAGSETDIAAGIRSAIPLFRGADDTKHLILLTDALQTVGEDPSDEVLSAVSEARAAGVTVSVIGIALDERGEELARSISDVGEGRLSLVRDVENLDMIVLEDYERAVR